MAGTTESVQRVFPAVGCGINIHLSLNLPFPGQETDSLRSDVNCSQLGREQTKQSRARQCAQGWAGKICHLPPTAAHCRPLPRHRISCASSTHFQCSTGLSFSCSSVSSCCSPALSAGPPASIKKSHSVLCFPSGNGQGRSSLDGSV